MLPVDPDKLSSSNDSRAPETGAAEPEPGALEPGADPDQRVPIEPVKPVATISIPPVGGEMATVRRNGPVFAVAVLVVSILGASALFMAGVQLGRQTVAEPGTPGTLNEEFKPFWNAWTAITERYAGEPVDHRTLIEGAIRGMVEAVGDPYSTYLDAEAYRRSVEDVSGQFEGIGAEIGTVNAARETTDCNEFGEDCRLVIVAPIEGSPAEKAGLLPGDIVAAVDGSSINGLSPDEARDRIRGKKGTQVTLTIDREGETPFDVTITRDTIVAREVVAEDLAGGKVGYIRLSGFSDHGADQFTAALKADIDDGKTKIIFDLRGNPGGYITAAREVASQFIAAGPVFWQQDAKGVQVATDALPDGVATDSEIEVVLLIDRGSASAAEIVAGALKDTGRATLLGETTFGKGTVQQWEELDGGAIKLTIARWLTPNKTWIHHVGVEPDVAVTVPGDTPAGSDPALERALELLDASAAAGETLPRAA
ncbi:MAG: S41 family peptidase [Chloroflexi bacterium]|nr:S41 family peptidase [Chloroflexota bacterium]